MITINDFKANTKEWLIDKLGNMSLSDTLQTISNLYNELHNPKYPTTYAKCCDVLSIEPYYNLIYYTYEHGYTEYARTNKLCLLQDKLTIFGKLFICRDAYWKIAGEEMGLSEPWEPDWKSGEQKKYCIYYGAGIIQKGSWCNYNSILAFPTEEMRDAFYETFKDLIEQCKELL